MDMNLGRLQDIVKGRGAWCTAVDGATKSWTRLNHWTRGWTQRPWSASLSSDISAASYITGRAVILQSPSAPVVGFSWFSSYLSDCNFQISPKISLLYLPSNSSLSWVLGTFPRWSHLFPWIQLSPLQGIPKRELWLWNLSLEICLCVTDPCWIDTSKSCRQFRLS